MSDHWKLKIGGRAIIGFVEDLLARAAQAWGEDTVDELWRLREEAKYLEDWAASYRHAIEEELFRRFEERNATRIRLSDGRYIEMQKASPRWDTGAVIKLGEFLIERAYVTEEEWKRIVIWEPKVIGQLLRPLRKHGEEVADRIDACLMGGTGRPQLKEGGEKR